MTEQVWNIYTSIATVVNFGILVWILYRIHEKYDRPLTRFLDERAETIAQTLEEAEEARANAEQAHLAAKARLDSLDSEIAKMRALAQEQIEATERELLQKAKTDAERARQQVDIYLQRKSEELLREIRERAAQAAIEAARNQLDGASREKVHQQLFSETLAEIDSNVAAHKRN